MSMSNLLYRYRERITMIFIIKYKSYHNKLEIYKLATLDERRILYYACVKYDYKIDKNLFIQIIQRSTVE